MLSHFIPARSNCLAGAAESMSLSCLHPQLQCPNEYRQTFLAFRRLLLVDVRFERFRNNKSFPQPLHVKGGLVIVACRFCPPSHIWFCQSPALGWHGWHGLDTNKGEQFRQHPSCLLHQASTCCNMAFLPRPCQVSVVSTPQQWKLI